MTIFRRRKEEVTEALAGITRRGFKLFPSSDIFGISNPGENERTVLVENTEIKTNC
jgi:hypothetical protein